MEMFEEKATGGFACMESKEVSGNWPSWFVLCEPYLMTFDNYYIVFL